MCAPVPEHLLLGLVGENAQHITSDRGFGGYQAIYTEEVLNRMRRSQDKIVVDGGVARSVRASPALEGLPHQSYVDNGNKHFCAPKPLQVSKSFATSACNANSFKAKSCQQESHTPSAMRTPRSRANKPRIVTKMGQLMHHETPPPSQQQHPPQQQHQHPTASHKLRRQRTASTHERSSYRVHPNLRLNKL
ncbi:unnamed protein product [Ectocarpus sp. 12 AP-2014]